MQAFSALAKPEWVNLGQIAIAGRGDRLTIRDLTQVNERNK